MALVMGVVPTIFLRQIDPAVKIALAPFAPIQPAPRRTTFSKFSHR